MSLSALELRRSLLRFFVILVLGALPWPGFDEFLGGSYRVLVGSFVEQSAIAGTAKVTLRASAPDDPARLESNSWNTTLWLKSVATNRSLPVTINPRRVAFLPCLVFVALVVAAPISRRGKSSCVAVGLGILWLLSVLWLFAMAYYLVETRMNPSFEASAELHKQLMHFLYRGILAPPASKLIGALFLGIGLVLRNRLR